MREVGGKYSKEIKEIILKYEEEGFIYFGEEKTTCEEKVEILKSILPSEYKNDDINTIYIKILTKFIEYYKEEKERRFNKIFWGTTTLLKRITFDNNIPK